MARTKRTYPDCLVNHCRRKTIDLTGILCRLHYVLWREGYEVEEINQAHDEMKSTEPLSVSHGVFYRQLDENLSTVLSLLEALAEVKLTPNLRKQLRRSTELVRRNLEMVRSPQRRQL